MTRHFVAVALLVLPAVASAQDGVPLPPGSTVVVGPPVLAGSLVSGPPITNGASALFPVQIAAPPRFSVGGGSMGAYPQVWVPSGAWGGAYYQWPVYPIEVLIPAPAPAATGRSLTTAVPSSASGRGLTTYPPLGTSDQTKATLVIQFPAATEVWVGGKKSDGDPAIEWTLTSPALEPGAAHTFEVKGRWKLGGKTFETSRSVTVKPGDRNRLIVASGTEIK
jgi:uncharacterized protein (TIGR03000 family)